MHKGVFKVIQQKESHCLSLPHGVCSDQTSFSHEISWGSNCRQPFMEQTCADDNLQGQTSQQLHISQLPTPYQMCSCYRIMVRPIIEYAASVWDPHTLSNINKLEAIQRRAARVCLMIFQDSVVSQKCYHS